MTRAGVLSVCVVAAALWQPGVAAAQLRVLFHYDDSAHFMEYGIAVMNALPAGSILEPAGVAEVIDRLRTEDWDFVLFVQYLPLSLEEHEGLAAGFERHISRGGTLAITYPHLDEAPELWEVLGVASAVDPVEPDAVDPTTVPRHPSWLGSGGAGAGPPTWWADFGDVVEPAPGSVVIGAYRSSGLPAVLESRGGHVIVNGIEWDDYGPAHLVGRDQARYLTMCIPDFDDNGVLDFFDFLAFQNAFAAKDPRADLVRPGGIFDIFDFLAFQDLFAYGCPRLQ